MGGHTVTLYKLCDLRMVADSKVGLQNIMTKLNEVVGRYKMKINEKKTKVMMIGKEEAQQVQISINGNTVEQVHQFKYLGSLL